MSDITSIALSGLNAYSKAMTTIADNVANANTPGYVTQNTQISEMPGSTASPLYDQTANPSGALVTGVTRSISSWLQDSARNAASDNGSASALSTWMQTSEAQLGTSASNIAANLTSFFNAADQLSSSPSDTALRQSFLAATSAVATSFNSTAQALSQTSTNLSAAAQGSVSTLNTDLSTLASVNQGLLRAQPNTAGANQLLNQRDAALQDLSSQIGITVQYGAAGDVSVSTAGSPSASLLSGSTLNPVALTTSASGTLSFSVGGTSIDPGSGALAGLKSAALDLSVRRAMLDQVATQFGSAVNALQVSGTDANGNAGTPLYDVSGGTAAKISALPVTTAQVAAAGSGVANGTMLAYAGLRGANGAESGWASIVSSQSQATASANAQASAAASVFDSAQQAVSGSASVNLNQQAGQLLQYQQAYQASAKVLQVAHDIFQSLYNIQ
ncbi:MAG: flagellar hook-associated protein FlgK [Alphaproteobacteria bacterium]|nr:flagellar hook-associated protein FlgK [Alphaproteobacteria bacterium]